MGSAGCDTHRLSRQILIDLLHYFEIVRKDLLMIGPVSVLTYQVPVNMNIERAVARGNQAKFGDTIAHTGQYFARHPDGAESMPSILTVGYTDLHRFLALSWIDRRYHDNLLKKLVEEPGT